MQDYYEILGVPRKATKEEIKRAFRNKIKVWHPDRNLNSQDAHEMTSLLTEAYQTLKDDVKRIQYDRNLEVFEQQEIKSRQQEEEWIPAHYQCAKCRRQNETLGYSIFIWVISAVVITYRNGWGAILCSRCRLLYSILFNLEVFFLGWWGFPFGMFYSLQALWKNSFGGIRNHDYNNHILGNLAFELLRSGNYREAHRVFKTYTKNDPSPEILEIVNEIELYYGSVIDKSNSVRLSKLKPAFVNIPLLVSLAVLSILIFTKLDKSNINKSQTASAYMQLSVVVKI